MREPKNQMLGTMEPPPPLMQLSVNKCFNHMVKFKQNKMIRATQNLDYFDKTLFGELVIIIISLVQF